MSASKLKSWLREPLLHFLLIGAGIYGLYALVGTEDVSDERQITITAENIRSLADQFARTWGRPPTATELQEVIRNNARVQVLYREALAMGLDDGDYVIERRLAQKLELLTEGLITPQDPTDEQLRDFFRANVDRYQEPDRYTITQVYFRTEEAAPASQVAQATLQQLQQSPGFPADIDTYGDASMLPRHLEQRTQFQLAREFGEAFAERIAELPAGEWRGPLQSGFGMHLVYVHDIQRGKKPEFESLKQTVREEWIAEQVAKLGDQFIDELMARYDIVIEEPAADATNTSNAASGSVP